MRSALCARHRHLSSTISRDKRAPFCSVAVLPQHSPLPLLPLASSSLPPKRWGERTLGGVNTCLAPEGVLSTGSLHIGPRANSGCRLQRLANTAHSAPHCRRCAWPPAGAFGHKASCAHAIHPLFATDHAACCARRRLSNTNDTRGRAQSGRWGSAVGPKGHLWDPILGLGRQRS
jgi:hypothetical protein